MRNLFGAWIFCVWTFLTGTFCFAQTSNLPSAFSGNFVAVSKKSIILRTFNGVKAFPLAKHPHFLSGDGSFFSPQWLLPGDGLLLFTNNQGEAVNLFAYVDFYSGILSFVAKDHILLSNGEEFYFDPQPPFFLNNEKVLNDTGFENDNPVLVRLNPFNEQVVGVWVFNFSHVPHVFQDIFQAHASLVKKKGIFLEVKVKARSHGMLFASLPGIVPFFRLKEKGLGDYQGYIPLPQNLTLPQTYLELTWSRSHFGRETRIFQKPIPLYTKPPEVSNISPPDGAHVEANPPFIFVSFNSKGAPLNPDSLQLFLDGKDITHETYRNAHLVFFFPKTKLSSGIHACMIKGKSQNALFFVKKKWFFVVKGDYARFPEKE